MMDVEAESKAIRNTKYCIRKSTTIILPFQLGNKMTVLFAKISYFRADNACWLWRYGGARPGYDVPDTLVEIDDGFI